MSRGQQGIGISAASMYGQLTTGKPTRIVSRTSARRAAHFYEIQIDTARNKPTIVREEEIEWEHSRGTEVEIGILYLGVGTLNGERVLVAEESADDGRSWNVIGTVSHPPETAHRGLGEPHLVETASGRLIGLFRVGGEDMSERFLYQADSDDGGRTWTPARVTPMLGFPPHLTRLQDDRLLVVYGRRLAPFGQRTCLSNDEGATWDVDNERIVQAAPNDDLGYPAAVQLPDGSIITVYYQVDEAGEKTCLMGTRWRL